MTSSQLDASLGESNTKGLLGLGVSTFADIRETLAAYEQAAKGDSAKDRASQERHLSRLDRLCTRWINEHRSQNSEQDKARNQVVRRLAEEIPLERMRRSQGRAQETYLDNLSAGEHLGASGPIASTRFDFTARTGTAAAAGRDARDGYATANESARKLNSADSADRVARANDTRMDFVKTHGLSPAEHAAIATYTVNDYKYINAATANRKDWLQTTQGLSTPKAMLEEGALHTAVAHQGLAKLPPYKGTAYRGEAFDDEAFKQIRVGSYTFPHLASSSKSAGTAVGWARGGRSDSKRNVVVWVLPDSGGKDIEALSLTDGEREVLIAAGSSFTIQAVTEVDLAAPGANVPTEIANFVTGLSDTAKAKNWNPAKVYVVRAIPAAKQASYQEVRDSRGAMRFDRR